MQQIIVKIVCSIIVLVALAAAAWVVVTGQLKTEGVDALFLVTVCLLAAALFSWVPLRALREAGLGKLLKFKKRSAQTEDARKAIPAATAERQERI